jgi:hypothetical protein
MGEEEVMEIGLRIWVGNLLGNVRERGVLEIEGRFGDI